MWRKNWQKPLLLRLQNIWKALTPGNKLWLPLCWDLYARKPMAKTKIQWFKWVLCAGSSSWPCLPSRATFCSTLQAGTLNSDLCIQSPPPTFLLFPSKASQRSQNSVQQHHWQLAAGSFQKYIGNQNILVIRLNRSGKSCIMYQKLQFNRQKMANLPPPSHHYPICSFKGSVKNWLLIWTSLSSQCKSTAIQNTMATSTALAGELLQFHKLFHKYIRLIKKSSLNTSTMAEKFPWTIQVAAEEVSLVKRQESMAWEETGQQICHKESRVE